MFEGTKMELHRELSYGRPNGSPARAILVLFFFSVTKIPWIQLGQESLAPWCQKLMFQVHITAYTF